MPDAARQSEDNYFHYFHAEAHALTGKLLLPFKEEIKKQAFVKLEGDSRDLLLEREAVDNGAGDAASPDETQPQENYLSQHAKNFRLEGIVSYSAAHTQVYGHRSKKHPGGFVTLATALVEDLNVLNVVTADRVVAQISTTHLPDQYSPEITFLGTHFENLRIARHRCEPLLRLGIAGKPPEGRRLYISKGTRLMESVGDRYEKLKTGLAGLIKDNPKTSLTTQYHGFDISKFGDIEAAAKDAFAGKSTWRGVTCSLVEHVEIKDISMKGADGIDVHIPPPAESFGHVIHIPGFGTIFLAELTVNHNSFNLNMIRLEMGCLTDGSMTVAAANVNGKGGKGGGG